MADLKALIGKLKSVVSEMEAACGEEKSEPAGEDLSAESYEEEEAPAPSVSKGGKKDILAGILSKKIK